MKFRVIHLEGYTQSPDYPYNYRIELVQYRVEEIKQLKEWLRELNIPPPHTKPEWGSVIYLRESDAALFVLRWS